METEILDFDRNNEKNLVMASAGKRLLNLLIDTFFFYFLIGLTGFIVGDLYRDTQSPDMILENSILLNLLSLTIYVLYYFTTEIAFGGRTMGKLVTGTKAVMANGDSLKVLAALGRSAARLIPFEAFSFLGSKASGWHDSLSNTVVLDIKKSKIRMD